MTPESSPQRLQLTFRLTDDSNWNFTIPRPADGLTSAGVQASGLAIINTMVLNHPSRPNRLDGVRVLDSVRTQL